MSAENRVSWVTAHQDTVWIYETPSGFRWRVRSANGEVVGHGESHPRIEDAVAAAERHHPREVES